MDTKGSPKQNTRVSSKSPSSSGGSGWCIRFLVWVPFLALLVPEAAWPSQRFSTLTEGTFETQLERPRYEGLQPGSPAMTAALKVFEKLPFDVGERIRYAITYLGIRGGSAEIVVHHPVKNGDAWSMRVTGEVLSAEWYAWIARVHDALEVTFDPLDDFKPLQFFMNQQESKYFNTKVLRFQFAQGKVEQTERRKGKEVKNETFELLRGTKDGVGALYFLRREIGTLAREKVLEFPIFTSEKTWTGRVKYLRSEEKKVFGTTFATDVFALDTQFGGLLQQEGDIRIWFSQDSRRLPVYIQADVAFGYIEVELAEWDQGFANPAAKTIYPKLRHGVPSSPATGAR
jgi:hypothetical protein